MLAPLKKAAILLASLDDETADELVAQMEPEQAARVRREMMALGEIDPEVQRQVVAEFRRGERPPRDPYPAGIELDSGLAEKIARSDSLAYGPAAVAAEPAEEPAPFRFLHQAEADTLVVSLRRERPQTIALVISHLAPSQAAEVVDRLPPALQAQVLRRLAELDETDPDVLRDVERHLQSWFHEHSRSRERRRAGLQALAAIISAAGGTARQQIVANLARHDGSLAETLGYRAQATSSPANSAAASPRQVETSLRQAETSPRQAETPRRETATPARRMANNELCFADLMKLNDARLRALIAAAQADVLVLALAGADAAFVERVVNCQPSREAKLLRRALKHLGPTRLSDVEEAQQALADSAFELEWMKSKDPLRNRPLAHAV